MSVVVHAVLRPREGEKEAVTAVLSEIIPQVHREDGCLLYALHEAEDGSLVFVEKWETAEDLAAHGAGPVIAELNARIGELLVEPATVTVLKAVSFGDYRGTV